MLIATDADDPGEELARRLRQELGARRCRRIVFRDGDALFKDANDALTLLEKTAFGWPLIIGGALKAVYDIMLLLQFRPVAPREAGIF